MYDDDDTKELTNNGTFEAFHNFQGQEDRSAILVGDEEHENTTIKPISSTEFQNQTFPHAYRDEVEHESNNSKVREQEEANETTTLRMSTSLGLTQEDAEYEVTTTDSSIIIETTTFEASTTFSSSIPTTITTNTSKSTNSPVTTTTTTTVKPVCNSDACLDAAHYLTETMNRDADDCTDLYEYVCGNWSSTSDIPDDHVSWGFIEEVGDNLEQQ